MIYLDNAATTLQKPPSVLLAVQNAMKYAAGYARGAHSAAMNAGETVYSCREAAASLFGVADPTRIVFTMNATHALNLAIHALCGEESRVLVGGYEHNAVMRPLHLRKIEPMVADAPLWDSEAYVERVRDALDDGANMMILNHVSNVFGYIAPLDSIAKLLTERNIPLILDASQSAGVVPIDVKKYPCLAAVCMPGHKALYGPQGTGILIALSDKIAKNPLITGGTGSVSEEMTQPEFLPDALESGTPNLPGIAGLAAGIAFIKKIGQTEIMQHETALIHEFARALTKETRILSFEGAAQTGVLSIVVDGMASERVAEMLSKQEVAVRAGLHCAPLAHRTGGTESSGTVRFSVSHFSSPGQIEKAADILCKIIKNR